MRKAQFLLPRAEGDPEDAEIGVFHFPAGGGSAQANIDRWVSQIAQPDGSPSSERAKVARRQVRSMPVTVVDVSGRYVAPLFPGSPDRCDKPDFRLLAAVIESSSGPWFVKLVGPARTVERWAASFQAYVDSARSQ